jgi:D-alanine-D-alanine ligase
MSAANKKHRIEISNAADFGKVAVMFGGFSSERDVSLDSGNAVLAALQSYGVDAISWDPSEKNIHEFNEAGFDRVWIALHGTGGEDGAVQGALEWLNTPYTGSDVISSALAMDKIRSKRLFKEADIATPDFLSIEKRGDAVLAAEQFGYPIILKPSNQGSSVGMSKVFEANELDVAVDLALGFSGVALAERCIVGNEITVAVLQGQALPSICIETPRVFYDYRAKYEADSTEYRCPGTDDPVLEAEYAKIAVTAFDVLGCSGWGRVDFMTGRDGKPQVLEVNTVPGMTSHSLVPMAAKAAGIDFMELCWRILETSISDQSAITYIETTINDA